MLQPPKTEQDLVQRARAMTGSTLATIAERLHARMPPEQSYAKGWVGRLIEHALGATAASRPEPDFVELSIELKTVPVDRHHRPRESTFIASIALEEMHSVRWDDSHVRRKLSRVLWLPVEAEPTIPLPLRRVGSPLLWSPSRRDESILRRDFEEAADLIAHGYIETLTAHRGQYLQVRPKASSSRARTWTRDEEGASVMTLPRGFYMRRSVTAKILALARRGHPDGLHR
jgi:DNA mismatch repair protein MutH